MPCQTADRPEVPLACSSRTKANLPSDRNTPLTDSNRPVSRWSKPSSRSPLIGEQPHPWPLLHGQDVRNELTKAKFMISLQPAKSLLSSLLWMRVLQLDRTILVLSIVLIFVISQVIFYCHLIETIVELHLY